MRFPIIAASLGVLAACTSDIPTTTTCCTSGNAAVRVVNAYNGPVDVLIDGAVAIPSLGSGLVDTARTNEGSHTLAFRPVGHAAGSSLPVTTSAGALRTIAAVRASSGAVGGAVLDDTGSVVPAGATKLRVLHLAPSAGVLQVFRTQPDYQTPIAWQFPFTYQAEPTALSAPFYQSTVGTWEVRIWQTPADASGWATATLRVLVPLASGEKRTILILDNPGGGVRVEVI
jgi:hypothetical protein